jgi:hypothetical protein
MGVFSKEKKKEKTEKCAHTTCFNKIETIGIVTAASTVIYCGKLLECCLVASGVRSPTYSNKLDATTGRTLMWYSRV